MGYTAFDLGVALGTPATLATLTTVQAEKPRSVATVAVVAGGPSLPGLPGDWQRALAGLDRERSPDPSIRDWPNVLRAAERFLADHGQAAVAFYWSDLQLFGLHAEVGTARVDCSGALLLSRGSPVVLVTDETIRFASGLAYRRTPLPRGVPVVPVWAFSPSC